MRGLAALMASMALRASRIRFRAGRPALAAAALLAAGLPAWSHLTSVSGGTRGPGRIGTGTGSMEVNDSLKASVDLYGYLPDSRAWNMKSGEPLGPGGKMPLNHNRYLYREGPFDRPYLLREDLRPLYQDFSYLPLWQPMQLAARLRYRFFPGVWGAFGLDYTGDAVQIVAKDATQILEVGELNLRWAPESRPGLAFSLGQLRLFGSYSPIFDQIPLENFRFAGVQAEYSRDLGTAGGFKATAASGREVLGRTMRTDPSMWRENELNIYLDAVRERNHLYGTVRWTGRTGLSLGLLGGFQFVPGDSTVREIANTDQFRIHRWRSTSGWQGGAEAGYRSKGWEHRLVLSHGRGDVQMGWSGPDAVQDQAMDSNEVRFTRKGSALTQAVYWMGHRSPRLRLEAGGWFQARNPSRREVEHRLVNNLPDTTYLRSDGFRAAKLSLQPALTVARPLLLGLRYDAILYLDPGAHANTIEPISDRALRPVLDSAGFRLEGPALWEREAVNGHILSPFAELDFGGGFHVRATWSGAWYSQPVYRQGTVGRFHANAVLAAWISFRFAQLDQL